MNVNKTNSEAPATSLAPHLALIAVQIMFGTWPIFGKLVLRSMSPTGLVAFRIFGAAAILTLVRKNALRFWRLPKNILAWILLASLLGVVFNQLLFVKGLSLTTAINATLLTTTIPIFTLIVSAALGYDRVTLRHILGICLAAAGVLYLVGPGRASFTAQDTIGILVLLLNSLCYGAYIAVSRNLFRRYGALNIITAIFLVGSLVTIPFAIVAWSAQDFRSVPPVAWALVCYIILIPTVGAYYLNSVAVTHVSPAVVAIYIYLQPLLAFGLAPIVLGESWNSRTVVSCILIFAGVAAVTVKRRRREEKLSEQAEASPPVGF